MTVDSIRMTNIVFMIRNGMQRFAEKPDVALSELKILMFETEFI